MKVGDKVQLRDQGPIYGITDIEIHWRWEIENVVNGITDIEIHWRWEIENVVNIKVDNQWYTKEQFHERFKLRKDLNG
jgi:hypothetical protein